MKTHNKLNISDLTSHMCVVRRRREVVVPARAVVKEERKRKEERERERENVQNEREREREREREVSFQPMGSEGNMGAHFEVLKKFGEKPQNALKKAWIKSPK